MRMPGPNTQVRVKAQGIVDIVRQSVEIDASGIREIARRQRACDRLGGVPPFQRVGVRRASSSASRVCDRGMTGPSQLSTMSRAWSYSRPSTCTSQST